MLIVVSLMTPAPERRKLAGLTFATVQEKIDLVPVEVAGEGAEAARLRVVKLARETAFEHRVNLAMTGVLVATVLGLWIYFR